MTKNELLEHIKHGRVGAIGVAIKAAIQDGKINPVALETWATFMLVPHQVKYAQRDLVKTLTGETFDIMPDQGIAVGRPPPHVESPTWLDVNLRAPPNFDDGSVVHAWFLHTDRSSAKFAIFKSVEEFVEIAVYLEAIAWHQVRDDRAALDS